MKQALILIALLLWCLPATAGAEPASATSIEAMPKSWRPSAELQTSLSDEPWSAHEEEDAQEALRIGVDEMLELYATHPEALSKLKDDAVESLIDLTYSGGTGSVEVDRAARAGATRNLDALVARYLKKYTDKASCEDFETLLPVAIYAYRIYSSNDPRIADIVVVANSAFHKCPSFADAVGNDYCGMLADRTLTVRNVSGLVDWAIQLNEAELVPGLVLPAEARAFPSRLWRYLQSYPLQGASTYPDRAWNRAFQDTGYLATHIAFVPTGYHRYPIYVDDLPSLYRFLRENFYATLEMGELDLVAQFVDTLRQYGYTEENDRQVRDGTRYLLQVFHANQDRWMNYREPGEADEDLDAYDLIHKAWSATIGLRRRTPDPPEPGTYGGVVRRWLPNASDR